MLYVDGREDKKHNWIAKLTEKGIEAEKATLSTDFSWGCPDGLVVVERKTWKDFASSFRGQGGVDGGNRLVGQLIDTKSASLKVLLLEGTMPKKVRLGPIYISGDAIDDALFSLEWRFGVEIIHSKDNASTASRLAAFYKYTQKAEHTSLARVMPPAVHQEVYMKPEMRRKIAAMICPPTIGEGMALLLPNCTESPKAAINLTVEQLMQLPGWGKARAERFVEFWSSW